MAFPQRLLTAIASTLLSWAVTLPALARPGMLSARDFAAHINIRAHPSVQSAVVTTGRSGDRIEVLSQTVGVDGYTWYSVETQGIHGWVRGDFVRFHTSGGSPGYPGVGDEIDHAIQNLEEQGWVLVSYGNTVVRLERRSLAIELGYDTSTRRINRIRVYDLG